ncbi:metal-sensing transcriptional repressor [Fictibacillus barbaricus]|uniref:DNA-binding FrmR family transcriptional regulator n=1 Tax=Fictibacillus barbaricus TaxID=182136 RepID=A0ABU1TVM2_9BACL|nr:metal-sensing transcriptional repressor [Fictibacillus barbaricus]MDR7071262.1 DNA-binding FrmR family transcriptional regulator [Fictibacillus barbaricus]
MDQKTHRCESDKQNLNNRLKKIEGQIRGLQKMIEEDRYCIDILVQISAVNAGLKRVGFQLMEQHTKHCLTDAIQSGDGEASIDELMKVVQQFSKS